MSKFRQLSPELWPLIDVILFSYIELIFCGGVSCLPATLLFLIADDKIFLAHLSRRLIGELKVYPWSGVHPSVVRPSSVLFLIADDKIFLAHLSRRLIGELIGYPWSGVHPSVVRPSVVRPSSVHNAQTSSSQKPLGRSKPNFMWSLLG